MEYDIDSEGKLDVFGKTVQYYQFIDFTEHTEYLYGCIEESVKSNFKDQLEYLKTYDKIRREIRAIIDIPDRKMDNLIKIIWNNKGSLSARKKKTLFAELTSEEVSAIESAIGKFL